MGDNRNPLFTVKSGTWTHKRRLVSVVVYFWLEKVEMSHLKSKINQNAHKFIFIFYNESKHSLTLPLVYFHLNLWTVWSFQELKGRMCVWLDEWSRKKPTLAPPRRRACKTRQMRRWHGVLQQTAAKRHNCFTCRWFSRLMRRQRRWSLRPSVGDVSARGGVEIQVGGLAFGQDWRARLVQPGTAQQWHRESPRNQILVRRTAVCWSLCGSVFVCSFPASIHCCQSFSVGGVLYVWAARAVDYWVASLFIYHNLCTSSWGRSRNIHFWVISRSSELKMKNQMEIIKTELWKMFVLKKLLHILGNVLKLTYISGPKHLLLHRTKGLLGSSHCGGQHLHQVLQPPWNPNTAVLHFLDYIYILKVFGHVHLCGGLTRTGV